MLIIKLSMASPPPALCPLPFSRQLLGRLNFKSLSCFISIPHSRKKLPHCHTTLFQGLSPTLFCTDRQERKQRRLGMRLIVIISNTLPFKSGNCDSKLNTNDSHIYILSKPFLSGPEFLQLYPMFSIKVQNDYR